MRVWLNLVFVTATLVGAMALPFAAYPLTVVVPDQYPTISEGLAAIGDWGDTVLVRSGVYKENVDWTPPSFHLIGEAGPASTIIVGRIATPHWDGQIDMVIRGFTVRDGGGIWISTGVINGRVGVSHCIIEYNDKIADQGPGLDGGGIYIGAPGVLVQVPHVVVDSCIIRNNVGRVGGGIYLYVGSARVKDCIVIGNSATERGGGVHTLVGVRMEVLNITIAENAVSAIGDSTRGAGINLRTSSAQARFTLSNTIVALNTGGIGVSCTDLSTSPTVTCTDVWGNEFGSYHGDCPDPTGTSGNISLDPLFCNPDEGDFRLQPGSPCLPENSPPGCGLIGALGSCSALSVNESSRQEALFSLGPNPASGPVQFILTVPLPSAVIEVFDSHGRTLEVFHPTSRRAVWTPSKETACGVYYARIVGNKSSQTLKFVLVK